MRRQQRLAAAGDHHISALTTTSPTAIMASSLRPHPSQANGRFFPMDLLREIPLRVPSAKTLCRLRAVCRAWRSLLSDAPFVADHAARHPGPLFAVSVVPGCYSSMPISNFYEVSDTPSRSPGAEIRFLDASGDIVKRVSTAPWCPFQILAHGDLVCLVESSHRLRLLDPATGATTLLPENEFRSMYVLGRTRGDGKLKVLSIATYGRYEICHLCQVLTPGDGAMWRDAPEPPVAIHTNRWQSAVVNGVAYFSVRDPGDDEKGCIAVFDLEREQWRPRLLPGPPAQFSYVWSSLVELNGRLVAVADMRYSVELWFLASDDQQQVLWCKQCTIQVPQAQRGFMNLRPLWVLDHGSVVFWASNKEGDHMLRVYDPATETCTDVATMADCMEVGIRVYTGSLLRVQGAHSEEFLNRRLNLFVSPNCYIKLAYLCK